MSAPAPDFGSDRHSGSGDVALAFLEALERWAAVDTSPSGHALRKDLVGFLREAQAAQPSMALVHQLAARALDVVDTGLRREDAPARLRELIGESCAAERADLREARAAVARTAGKLVTSRGSWLATLSMSGTVRDAIAKAHAQGLAPRALVGEGRPRLEGRDMASALAASGVPTWLVADAALPLLLGQASMLWLGADAVTDQGAINKIGSFGAALAARERSVPVYVMAERRKFLPATTGSLKIVEMPGAEIWDSPAAGVEPRNVYFELVPFELIRGVVVEDGVLGAREARVVALERPLPAELAAG
jgi:translation initiation factor 2B subunit (eIF-2B alpha/beta/delta family)